MKALYIGLGILASIGFAALIMQDPEILLVFAGLVAVISLILAGIFSGALNSGDRNRANFHTESKKQRNQRWGTATFFTFVGIPNALAAFLAYVFLI
ncbi:hypothetical protein CR194_03825 [Salipaludibacillus keqinensis]|uniref:DUF5316 domain-containing protein n=1 Tax=Salipaludibacillus keqinensis TaxID=2045207 RepID=A0A323TIV2_9BACI|nr:DUF5316 domain-containing protein [Salipaludibacillus keqinensis]PYZ94669.1 hypothetical protein CR194_03825 [Salipaludibacillus keqinensis]